MPRKHPSRERARRGRAPKAKTEAAQSPFTAQQEHEYRQRQTAVCHSKDRYDSESQARAFALMHQPGPGDRANVYLCEICGGWHHTRSR